MAGTYCVLADVQSEFKALVFSASTTPTDTQVNGFITQACVEIETKVGMKYQVPVTGTDSLAFLQQIAISLVAGRVKNILPVKTGSQDVDSGGKGRPGDLMIKWGRDTLGAIAKGDLTLRDASLLSSTDGVTTGIAARVTGVPQESALTCAPTHLFRRDEDQW